MRYPLPWFPLSDDPSRCNCRTTANCRLYRSSHAGYRFGRSGSSGFGVGFRRLRLSSFGLAPKARRSLGRCRYRYICRPGGFPVGGGCHPKRSGFGFRGRLKLLRFSDDLCLSFCPRRRRCRTKFLLCRDLCKKALPPDSRNPNTGFRLFPPLIAPDFTQIPP